MIYLHVIQFYHLKHHFPCICNTLDPSDINLKLDRNKKSIFLKIQKEVKKGSPKNEE
jgi:hypothetical protein